MKFLSKAKSYFYAQRARRNARAESGRSMVEILGVLAIIGVITVGAMIGYRYAMERIMTNSIITGVRARAVVIGQQRVLGHPLNLSEFHPDTEKDLIYGHFEVKVFEDYYEDGSGYQALKVYNIPKRVCEKIQDIEFPDDHITLVNGDEVGDTPKSCIPDGPTENTGNIHDAGDYFTAEYHNTVTFVFMELEDVECDRSEQCAFCNSCIDGFCTPDENGARCGGPSGGCCIGGRCLPPESPACRCISTYGDDPLGRAYACCLQGYPEGTRDWTCCLNPDDAVCQEPADRCAGKTCGDCLRCDSVSDTCVADSDKNDQTCGSNGCSVCKNGSCLNKMTQIKKCDGTKENCCPLTATCTDETDCPIDCTETPGPCQKCDTTTGKLVPDKEGESCGTCGTCTNGECQEQTKTVTTCSGERTCCLDDPTCQDETDCPCDPACGNCERCVSGVCQTDSSIPGCGGGCPNGCGECEVCENGTCVPDMTLPGCTKCNADDECPKCQLCDSATGKCQAVPDGNMCGDCKACQNGQCVDAGTTVITKCDRTTANCCSWNGTHTCEDETGCCETNDDCNKENCETCDTETGKCKQNKMETVLTDCDGTTRTCCTARGETCKAADCQDCQVCTYTDPDTKIDDDEETHCSALLTCTSGKCPKEYVQTITICPESIGCICQKPFVTITGCIKE